MVERFVELLATRSLGLGYLFVFTILLACGFGFPLPEDVVLITGGVLAWLASPLESATAWALPSLTTIFSTRLASSSSPPSR